MQGSGPELRCNPIRSAVLVLLIGRLVPGQGMLSLSALIGMQSIKVTLQ